MSSLLFLSLLCHSFLSLLSSIYLCYSLYILSSFSSFLSRFFSLSLPSSIFLSTVLYLPLFSFFFLFCLLSFVSFFCFSVLFLLPSLFLRFLSLSLSPFFSVFFFSLSPFFFLYSLSQMNSLLVILQPIHYSPALPLTALFDGTDFSKSYLPLSRVIPSDKSHIVYISPSSPFASGGGTVSVYTQIHKYTNTNTNTNTQIQ